MRFMQENNYQILFVESEAYTLARKPRPHSLVVSPPLLSLSFQPCYYMCE